MCLKHVFSDDGLIIVLHTGMVIEASDCVYAPKGSELYSKIVDLAEDDYDITTFKLLDYRELMFRVE